MLRLIGLIVLIWFLWAIGAIQFFLIFFASILISLAHLLG